MTASHEQGPLMTYGLAAGTVTTESNPQAGPNLFFQGDGLLDPRFPYGPGGVPTFQPGGNLPGGRNGIGIQPGLPSVAQVGVVDAIPWVANAAAMVAAATATSGTPMTLSASGNGIYVNVPIVPFGSAIKTANVVKASIVGPGHASVTTASASATVTGIKSFLLKPGMWVCIPDATAAGTPLIAQVLTVTRVTPSGTLSVVLSVAAGATVTNGTLFLMDASGTCVANTVPVGAAALFDARAALTRGFSVTSNNAGDTGWTVTARGYDAFWNPMTEAVAVTANGTAYGAKAFKAFSSFTPSNTGSTTGTLSIGTSNTFGVNVRADTWEATEFYFAGASVAANTGFTAASGTFPATGTSGDTRGTMQFGALGAGAGIGSTVPTGTAANIAAGTGNRLKGYVEADPNNLYGATYFDYESMFGVAQYAG